VKISGTGVLLQLFFLKHHLLKTCCVETEKSNDAESIESLSERGLLPIGNHLQKILSVVLTMSRIHNIWRYVPWVPWDVVRTVLKCFLDRNKMREKLKLLMICIAYPPDKSSLKGSE
jgi:hypothetical protein